MSTTQPKRRGAPRTSPLWALAAKLADRKEGVCLAELDQAGGRGGTGQGILKTLTQEGAIYRVALSVRIIRYFAHEADARAFEQLRNAPLPSVRNASTSRHHAPWPADAPMVITAKTKVTVAPPMPRALRSNTHSQF